MMAFRGESVFFERVAPAKLTIFQWVALYHEYMGRTKWTVGAIKKNRGHKVGKG